MCELSNYRKFIHLSTQAYKFVHGSPVRKCTLSEITVHSNHGAGKILIIKN